MLKILDLFCGIGGVARGFHDYLQEHQIKYLYVASDIDKDVLKAHRALNPLSNVILRDAYTFNIDELKRYDFIWASPPCETHSIAGIWRGKERNNPDFRLYKLIEILFDANIPFVVENVKPYYNPPIKPTSTINRHLLWSNLRIPKIKIKLKPFDEVKDTINSLCEYHDIPPEIAKIIPIEKRRDVLRDMLHHDISYEIARLVIPHAIERRIITQTKLNAWDGDGHAKMHDL